MARSVWREQAICQYFIFSLCFEVPALDSYVYWGMPTIAEAPATYQTVKKPFAGSYLPVLSEPEWRAVRLASIRGVSDKDLAETFNVQVNTIIKRRTRDPEWTAALAGAQVSRKVTTPPVKEISAKLTETVVTQSLDQIGTENNLLAAQFAHAAMRESIKSGLVAAPSNWSELTSAHKMVRTATGQDKEGASVNVSLWGAGAVAIAGAHDPFDSAVDVSPSNQTNSCSDEWI
jgi:hypothetical protein